MILVRINCLLVAAFISILVFGIVLILKRRESDVYRKYLISMLTYWASTLLYVYSKFYIEDLPQVSYNFEAVSVSILLLGIPCFISIIIYPIVVLDAKFFTPRNWFKLLAPLSGIVLLYFMVNLIAGTDPFRKFSSLNDILTNIGSMAAFSRLAMVIGFLIYVILLLKNIWKIVPVYNQHIQDTISDTTYNVDWVRQLVKYIIFVTIMYFSVLFTPSPYVNMVYMISVIALFGYIIGRSLFNSYIEDVNYVTIRWFKEWTLVPKRQKIVQEKDTETEIINDNYEALGKKIDEWMESSKAYTKVNFTTEDIIICFPNYVHDDLTHMFKEKGETFQSYVRKYRIKLACEIIKEKSDEVYPKQLYSMVGFSHYSSFSRAFFAVVGMSPTDYISEVENSKK